MIRNLKKLIHLNTSVDNLNQVITDKIPIHDPIKIAILIIAKIFMNGLDTPTNSGLSLICTQEHPFQIAKDVSIKKTLPAIISGKEVLE